MFLMYFCQGGDIVDCINKKAICVSIRFYCLSPSDIGNTLGLGSITFQNQVFCTNWTLFWPRALFGSAVMLVSQLWCLSVAVDRASLYQKCYKEFTHIATWRWRQNQLQIFYCLLHMHTHTHTHTSNENTPINLTVPDALVILVYRYLN